MPVISVTERYGLLGQGQEHALALLCREISLLDSVSFDYAERLGALIEIGVTLWHYRELELRRQ